MLPCCDRPGRRRSRVFAALPRSGARPLREIAVHVPALSGSDTPSPSVAEFDLVLRAWTWFWSKSRVYMPTWRIRLVPVSTTLQIPQKISTVHADMQCIIYSSIIYSSLANTPRTAACCSSSMHSSRQDSAHPPLKQRPCLDAKRFWISLL